MIEELQQISAKVVTFIDDNFFADMQRAERICDLILENKIKKIFLANAWIGITRRPELVKKLYQAGFCLLAFGIESAQDRSLKQLNKGFNTKQAKQAFEVLRKANTLTMGYFIIGIMGETKQDMLQIGSYANELGLDFISLNRLRYEKYSGLKGLLETHPNYHVDEGIGRIYSDEYGPNEINRILKDINQVCWTPRKIIGDVH